VFSLLPPLGGANQEENIMKEISSPFLHAVHKTLILILFISLAFQFQGCKKQDVNEQSASDGLTVPLKNTETYNYPTVDGDEDGASIKQASHYEVSEIRRNASTNFIAVYTYQPKSGYVGLDYVEIEICTGSNGASSPTNIRTVKINFVISN
jgi:hypothetical protein